MKYLDRRFTVRVGDTEAYRNNFDLIKWPDRGDKQSPAPTTEENKEELQEDKKD